jgi:hypothetical protein
VREAATFGGGPLATIRPPASPARGRCRDPVAHRRQLHVVIDEDDAVAGVDQGVELAEAEIVQLP